VLAASPPTVQQTGHPSSVPVIDNVPGVVGDVLWLLRTGTQVGIDLTAAAYAASDDS
jgi:hypothetical protein